MPWLNNNTPAAAAAARRGNAPNAPQQQQRRVRVPAAVHAAQLAWLRCWAWWLLGGLVLPLLRNSFYVTESEPYRQQVFYYRYAKHYHTANCILQSLFSWCQNQWLGFDLAALLGVVAVGGSGAAAAAQQLLRHRERVISAAGVLLQVRDALWLLDIVIMSTHCISQCVVLNCIALTRVWAGCTAGVGPGGC
jgi:hypothetical protein